MKKLIVFMPSFKAGGAQRVLSIIMNRMVDKDYAVTLALIKENAPIEYKLDDRIEIVRNTKYSTNKLLNVIREILFMRHIMKKNAGATILSFITTYNIYAVLAAFGINVKIVVSERNDPKMFRKETGALLDNLRNVTYAKANCVVFQTEEAKNFFAGVKNLTSVIIPNPITDNLPVKVDYDDPIAFVAVARLEEQKNYPLMLDAMDIVAEKHPEAMLYIYGKGSKEASIKEYYAHLKHANNVIFAGFTNDVPSVLMGAYAFVLSSDYEGISNSMLEALAIGVPCVCTDCPCGGCRMFIEDHVSGLLTPVGDKEAFAKAMIEMIETPDKRKEYGERSKRVREQLDQRVIFQKWFEVLSKDS